MVAAIEFEVKRQIEALERGEKLTQETRGWNEDKKETYLQRSKEEAHDYRYFPEPDLPELKIKNYESRIKEEQVELPTQKIERFQKEHRLNKQQAAILAGSRDLAEFFEKIVVLAKEKGFDPKQIANYIINKKPDLRVGPSAMLDQIMSQNTGIISDEGELEKICKEVINEDSKSVNDFKSGKENALQALIGGVMRKTAGKADAGKVSEILKKILG